MFELDFKNKNGIFIFIYPFKDKFLWRNSFTIYRGNEIIVSPTQSYIIQIKFISKINDEKVFIEFSVDSKEEALKYAIYYITIDENEFLNYNLKNIFLNKSNNIEYISWEPYINKNIKLNILYMF